MENATLAEIVSNWHKIACKINNCFESLCFKDDPEGRGSVYMSLSVAVGVPAKLTAGDEVREEEHQEGQLAYSARAPHYGHRSGFRPEDHRHLGRPLKSMARSEDKTLIRTPLVARFFTHPRCGSRVGIILRIRHRSIPAPRSKRTTNVHHGT